MDEYALNEKQLKELLSKEFPTRYSEDTKINLESLDILFLDKLIRLHQNGDIVVFALVKIKSISNEEKFFVVEEDEDEEK